MTFFIFFLHFLEFLPQLSHYLFGSQIGRLFVRYQFAVGLLSLLGACDFVSLHQFLNFLGERAKGKSILCFLSHLDIADLFLPTEVNSRLPIQMLLLEVIGKDASEGKEVQSWTLEQSVLFVAKLAESYSKLDYSVSAFVFELLVEFVVFSVQR